MRLRRPVAPAPALSTLLAVGLALSAPAPAATAAPTVPAPTPPAPSAPAPAPVPAPAPGQSPPVPSPAPTTPPAVTYSPQGATWRRDGTGTAGLYTLSWPRMGAEGGPAAFGVRVWQELLNERGYPTPMTGRYDWLTAHNVKRLQRASSLPETGQVNFPTARRLLAATIRREAELAGIPVGLLCGHVAAESMLDPRSVGRNGVDLGIAQISRTYNLGVTDEQAFDEDFAIRYMAQRDATAYARYGDWRLAVVSYNSPVRADAWRRNGFPDPVAEAYARRAFLGCGPISGQVTVTTEKTLWRLAMVHLGDPFRWREIAALNGLTREVGPRAGQLVRLPQP